MKKRLLVYLSVIIGCLFIGLTTFYLVKNHEIISATGTETYYLNVNESASITISHLYKHRNTEIEYTLSQADIVSFDIETGEIKALNGGSVDLKITTTNDKYGPFSFKIYVGNGKSEATPLYIKTAEDLQSIGGLRKYNEEESYEWKMEAFYQLNNDIDLKNIEWTPIGKFTDDDNDSNDVAFTGQFFGDDFSINNLTITESAESVGLFAFIAENAVIESVKFNNASLKGSFDMAGVISGVSYGSTISQVEIINSEILLSPKIWKEDGNSFILQFAGGVVGHTFTDFWEAEGAVDGYAYDRTNITMSSFIGEIGVSEDFHEAANVEDMKEVYIALGGIVGFNNSAVVFNNRAEVDFVIEENFVNDSKEMDFIKINVGGIVGLIDLFEVKNNNDVVVLEIKPLIKNNLAIIDVSFLTDETGGVVGKIVANVEQCILGNFFFTTNSELTKGGSMAEDSTTQIANKQALGSEKKYKTNDSEKWSIGEILSVWIIIDGVPQINFESGMVQDYKYLEKVFSINNATEFKYYYDKMTTPATTYTEIRSRKFWLSQNYILKADINLGDVEIVEFAPIGYDYIFMGTFNGNGHKLFFNKNEDDKILITNVEKDGVYKYVAMGIFSINKGKIQNLTVENALINYGEFAGIIAGVNSGEIIDCVVINPEIQDGVCYGLMVGMNKKNIINTTTDYSEDEIPFSVELTIANEILGITEKPKSIYVGGIAGFNSGRIDNIKISGELIINAVSSTHDIVRVIGGVVGFNDSSGIIKNSSISKAYISDNSQTITYVGGFCGINDGFISKSYTGELFDSPTKIITETDKGNQIAGGFVARLGYGGKIEQSFANVSVKGYYVAGFAPNLFGEVSECYVRGSIEGEYVGGFAATLISSSEEERGGYITNCYTILKISGLTDESITAGISLLVKNPGKIEKCFFSNTFVGKGSKFLETYVGVNSKILKKLVDIVKSPGDFGIIDNVVIDIEAAGNNEKEIVSSGKILADKNQKVFYISNNEALNSIDILNQAKFNIGATGIWTVEANEFPSLTELDLDGISQKLSTEENELEEDEMS